MPSERMIHAASEFSPERWEKKHQKTQKRRRDDANGTPVVVTRDKYKYTALLCLVISVQRTRGQRTQHVRYTL